MSDIRSLILHQLKREPLKPGLLAAKLSISRQAMHKHLLILVEENQIQKKGKGAHVVYYVVSDRQTFSRVRQDYDYCRTVLLPQYLTSFADHIDRAVQKSQERMVDRSKDSTMSLEFLIDTAAVYSSNIEGNTLDINSFLNSRMAPIKHRSKEAKEIEDLVSAYEYAKKHKMNEKKILKSHGILSKEFVAPSRQGRYRQEPVGVYSQDGLEYMAIEPHLVEQEMQELLAVIRQLLFKKQTCSECFFWATWVHLMIALIHPFSDGNGRTARLCEKWFLMQTLGTHLSLFQSEECYWKKRPQYYTALKLGVNYWETKMQNALPFFALLPECMQEK